MKSVTLALIIVLAISVLIASPEVTNVTSVQRDDGSYMVDVYYDLANAPGLAMTVMLIGSNDNGYTWEIPCPQATGDVGQNIFAGTSKHIVWNAAIDFPNTSCSNFRFKILAFDGSVPPFSVDFAYVNGGTFTMGNTLSGGDGNELPLHEVTVSSFIIGRYEVTQGEWLSVMGSNPAGGPGIGSNYSVYNVSWYSILKYCNLRSIMEGLTPVYSINGSTNPADWGPVPGANNDIWNAAICNWGVDGYRLPTEAEWEYAARGGSTTPDYIYSGSDEVNAVAWFILNSGATVHQVGGKTYNNLSLYDMSGNVWEWCWDWYSAYVSEGQINPTGPQTGSVRLLRGGCWDDSANNCRVSRRYNRSPNFGDDSYGFRVCRSVR